MTKQCVQCSKTFLLEPRDLEFYKKIQVPEPTLCPDCRQQRRLAWCNEGVFYKDHCDRCTKNIISQLHPSNPRPVWCLNCWWKYDWSALDYAQDIDWSRSFFEQFHELELKVPHACVSSDEVSENSEYTHHAGQNKNCYLIFHATFNENCMYSYGIKKSKDCIDNHNCFNSELCYECVDIHNCYNLGWSQDCYDCNNSRFLRDCRSVSDSFLCVGLRNKQYCFLNEQLTTEQYAEKMQNISTNSLAEVHQYWQQFIELQQKHTYRFAQTKNIEDVSGNYLTNAKSTYHSYDCTDVEHVKYGYQLQLGAKDIMDVYQFGNQAELIYESAMIGTSVYNIKFGYLCIFGASDLTYCIECYNGANNCFGCFGLKRDKFCILNKQYSKSEYKKTVQKIVEHMKKINEWGEFFPIQYSQSAYNETMAQLWYPLSQQKVLSNGWQWQDQIDITAQVDKEDVSTCQKCHTIYKITPQEFKFYQQNNYPLPEQCFQCRRLRRMKERNPRQLWQRQCMCTQVDHGHASRCPIEFETTYSPDRKEIVYCEQCYQKEIY